MMASRAPKGTAGVTEGHDVKRQSLKQSKKESKKEKEKNQSE
jgi:hypothetical protein